MCGRYALSIRAAFVRYQFEQHGMPIDEAPDEDETRATYNFAPGYYGLVYRADVSPSRAGHSDRYDDIHRNDSEAEGDQSDRTKNLSHAVTPKFKLQAMRWGLIPFWTKRSPDYGSMMKSINARDDSLAENRGMWTSMKKTKRCIVVAEGFYEWLKKNGGRDKIPHFVKRKDGRLMLFAGLWDCATYEGSEDRNWTYTIITTDSNKQLKFLHDRMPVILENSSDAIRTWLDPSRTEWTSELQSLLKPFSGDLDCYQVSKDVGKVGNDSPNFVIPITSSENKSNIANFFANAKQMKKADDKALKDHAATTEDRSSPSVYEKQGDVRDTINQSRSEDNAPMPGPPGLNSGEKRGFAETSVDGPRKVRKVQKTSSAKSIVQQASDKKSRSATSNNTDLPKSSPKGKGQSQKITDFLAK